jgi:hypothetical protein
MKAVPMANSPRRSAGSIRCALRAHDARRRSSSVIACADMVLTVIATARVDL